MSRAELRVLQERLREAVRDLDGESEVRPFRALDRLYEMQRHAAPIREAIEALNELAGPQS